MRYFVVMDGVERSDGCYVLAEVVRDFGEGKELTLAAALAGAQARIVSRTELERAPGGRRALQRWRLRDDSAFDAESDALARATRRIGTRRLRSLAHDERADVPHRGRLSEMRRPARLLRFLSVRERRRGWHQRSQARQREVDELAPPSETVLRP